MRLLTSIDDVMNDASGNSKQVADGIPHRRSAGEKWVAVQSPSLDQSHRRKLRCLGDTSVRSVGISQMRGSRALSASRPHVRGDGEVAKLNRESGEGYLECGRAGTGELGDIPWLVQLETEKM